MEYPKRSNNFDKIYFFSKDARLPEMLQRAMAAEAEASREARAKVSSRADVFLS